MTEARWARTTESGTLAALRFAGWLARRVPRPLMRALLWPVALYYYLRRPAARRASRQYLERIAATPEGRAALGRAPGPGLVLLHLHHFAVSIYDRFLVWSGTSDDLSVEHDGSGAAFGLGGRGRGALLLGTHLGSFDLLWFLSRKHRLRVTVVVFFQNAARVNAFLRSRGQDAGVRAIEIDPGSVRAAFEIRACLERGEIVVILADRIPPGGGRVAETSFLGRPAAFPLAPFLLPGVLRCPVFLALCVSTGDARYRTVLRPLGEGTPVPRAEREKRARELLERYVALLESFCLAHPLDWFNFYPFWDEA